MATIPESIEKKKFLMDMIMKGKRDHTEDILGSKMVLRVLDDAETTEAHKEASGFDMVTRVIVLRKALLSRALVSVSLVGSGEWIPQSVSETAIFLGKLAPSLVEHIFNKYDAMVKFRDSEIELALKAEKDDTLKN
jgi:hypothetical protein